MKVMHDNDADLIKSLRSHIDTLENELMQLNGDMDVITL